VHGADSCHHSRTGDCCAPGDRLPDRMARHIGWVLTRWQRRVDGKTARQRIRGRDYTGEVLAFSEVCNYKLVRGGQFKLDPLWAKSVWVGTLELTSEHLIMAPSGTAKARSVQQVPASELWDKEFVSSCRGLPWNPREDSGRDCPGAPPLLGSRQASWLVHHEEYGRRPWAYDGLCRLFGLPRTTRITKQRSLREDVRVQARRCSRRSSSSSYTHDRASASSR
jgi:hypothetical protein